MQVHLDQLLDQLDEEWTRQGRCDLGKLIHQLPDARMETIVELCVADFEWRWRARSKNPQLHPALPDVNAYREFLNAWWGEPACQKVLLQTEWLARSVWGDKPRIDAFLASSSFTADALGFETIRGELIESLNLSVQLEIQLRFKTHDLVTVAIPSSFSIGRQKVGEPPPPYWDAVNQRLVAWPLEYVQFSREQLRVQRVRALEMRVSNLSDGRAIQISGFELLPRQSGHFGIPIQLQAADTILTITPADTSFPRTKHR
jgi:hypothetical protein